VRSQNTIVDEGGTIRFTDFCAAHFAPATVDVAMVRTQWLMGAGNRELADAEMQAFVQGYQGVRPLSDEEIESFPLIWAAYYAQRLCFLHLKWSPSSKNRRAWPVGDLIRRLPDEAIRMGEAAFGGS
jgi:Ser/Thr protein kinase RdoA (MazF antagonist)